MSVDRSCECGAMIPAYVIVCKACGKNFKARDGGRVEQEITPESPLRKLASQYEDKDIQKNYDSNSYSLPSSVRTDSHPQVTLRNRSDRRNKKSLRDKASLLVFLLFMIVVIFSATPGAFRDSIFQKVGLQESFSLDFQEDQMQFKFLEFADNGVPVYFKGCGPIDYYVRQNYASTDDLSIVSTALSVVGSGIGRSFTFKGTTQERDISKQNSVLINFTSGLESEEIQNAEDDYHQDVAGLGGPSNFETTSKPRFGSRAATSGNIWIKQEEWQIMSRDQKTIVVMHEMGHVLGLTHPVNGFNQIMDSGSYYGTSLGSGDLLGLQILSALAGCRDFPDYLNPMSTQSSATDENTDLSNESDVYIGEVNALGQARLDRSLISTSLNSCGNDFPEPVQNLNEKFPTTWQMFEDDGCGSGQSYTWSDPRDKSEFVLLQFNASVGWCQDIYPDDLDEIKYRFAPEANSFKKVNLDSGRNAYVYTRTSPNPSKDIYGVIEIGNVYNWCGDGQTLMEFGEIVQSNDELYSEVLKLVFGEF